MLKTFVYAVFFQLLISLAYCNVLFEENFSKQVIGDDASQMKVLDGSLDFKFHQEKGNHLYIKDNNAGIVYKLDKNITKDTTNQTLYLSFNLRSLNNSHKAKYAGFFLYQNGQEVFGVGNDYTSENFSFWIPNVTGNHIGEIPTHIDNDVHMVVIRIDIDSDGPEKIKIGLDPFCRRSEARQPDHIWTEYEYQLSFDEIRLRSGNNDCIWEFDEILIGSDWESVTPANNEPGAYIDSLKINMTSSGKAEKIADKIARFWPTGIDDSKVLPSFILKKPLQSIGSIADPWKLKPQFGTFNKKRYVYLDIPAEVDLYGTGEVTGSLLRNGYKIILYNKDNYAYSKPDQLYQSHPWVLGLRKDGSAFGVIFDTTWKAELDLRAGILFTTSIEAQDFPVIIIEGKNPQNVMVQLADLTGCMPMPPRWALGYQQCRYSYYPDARVREIVDTFRAKRIPCDVLWFDIDYMDGFRIFTFDSKQFPDPKATNNYLHSLGFKSVWMIDPGVKYDPGYFVYDSGTQQDVWVRDSSGKPFIGPVWPGDCVFPDFTMPKTRQWWGDLYKKFIALGIDGVWNDMNEPAVFKGEWTMPSDCRHRGGNGLPPGPHEQYHNVYGLLMVKASREGIQKARPEKRPFVLSRANFLGGHRYAATWTGDNTATWDHLKWSIPMSLNLSLSGQPFNGPDIGGFADNATPELWAHWISVGAFYPFSRAHSVKESNNQEPWSFGPETEQAARIALQRRYRLMPYIYTLFRDAHDKGMPVMQPVFFADAKDASLRMEDQTFLLGSDLLVIPQWAKDPVLPKGIWQSISLVGEDGQTDPYQCDLKVRGGSIIPVGPVMQTTEAITSDWPLTLFVVLDKNGQAKGHLYEDAGDGYGYIEKEFCLSTFTAQKQDHEIFVKCIRQEGKQTFDKRLATVAVINEEGIRYGFGDLISGIKVKMDSHVEKITETAFLR